LQTLKIQTIRRDCGTQIRVGMSEDTVSTYTESMRTGATFPPVIVYRTPSGLVLVDGFHRVEAAQRAGLAEVRAEVIDGSERDAVLHAVGVNAGLGRSNEDKRRAVETLLRDPEWGEWSDREIARRARVSPTLVGRIRRDLTVHVDSEKARKYITRHGTESTMDTSAIGAFTVHVDSEKPSTRVIGDAYSQVGPNDDDYCTDLAPADEGEVFEAEEPAVGGFRGGLGGNPGVPMDLSRIVEQAGLLQCSSRPKPRVIAIHRATERAVRMGVDGIGPGPARGMALAELADDLAVGVNGWWILCTRPDDDEPTPAEREDARALIEAAGLLGVTIHGVVRGEAVNQHVYLLAAGAPDAATVPAAAPAPTPVQTSAPTAAARTCSVDEVKEAAKLLRKAVARLRSAVGGDLPEQAARRLEARLSGIEETIAIADGTVAATRASAQASGPARARTGDSLSLQRREGDQDQERESRARPGAREAGRARTHEADLVAGLDPEAFADLEASWLAAATKPRGQLNDPARRELVAVLADFGVEKVAAAIKAIALEAHPNPNAAWIRDRIEGRGPAAQGGRRRQRKADPISTDQDQWAQVAEQTNAYGWQP